MAGSNEVIEAVKAVAQKIEEQKDYLTELDQPIGDSDHGINLARGYAAVLQKLPALCDKDTGTILKTVGMTLVSTVGGASGPLYGSAYMKAGMAVAGKYEITARDFVIMLEAAVEAVQQRGHAKAEEATMLDAMIPSLKAMQESLNAGKPSADMLKDGVSAAWAGAKHTKDLVATKGRASYVGERGLGHMDPGAASYSFTLEAIAETFSAS